MYFKYFNKYTGEVYGSPEESPVARLESVISYPYIRTQTPVTFHKFINECAASYGGDIKAWYKANKDKKPFWTPNKEKNYRFIIPNEVVQKYSDEFFARFVPKNK